MAGKAIVVEIEHTWHGRTTHAFCVNQGRQIKWRIRHRVGSDPVAITTLQNASFFHSGSPIWDCPIHLAHQQMVDYGLQVALVLGDRNMLLATRAVGQCSIVCAKGHGYHGRWVGRVRGCL